LRLYPHTPARSGALTAAYRPAPNVAAADSSRNTSKAPPRRPAVPQHPRETGRKLISGRLVAVSSVTPGPTQARAGAPATPKMMMEQPWPAQRQGMLTSRTRPRARLEKRMVQVTSPGVPAHAHVVLAS